MIRRIRLNENVGNEYYNKFIDIYEANKNLEPHKLVDRLREALLPREGRSANVGTEIIRALLRVYYRSYNDGDYFFWGYGLETAGPSMAFVYYHIDSEKIDQYIEDMTTGDLIQKSYRFQLGKLTNMVLEYLTQHPELFDKPTESCVDFDCARLQYWIEDYENEIAEDEDDW